MSETCLVDPIPDTKESIFPNPFQSLKILVSEFFYCIFLRSISDTHLYAYETYLRIPYSDLSIEYDYIFQFLAAQLNDCLNHSLHTNSLTLCSIWLYMVLYAFACIFAYFIWYIFDVYFLYV